MILQRYIFRELLISFILTCLSFTLVMFLGAALQQIHRFEELGFGFVVAVAPYLVPFLLAFTVPISTLAAATIVYGRLAADNEILAMRASGIHPWRVMAPAIALGAGLSLFLLVFNERVVPEAKHQTKVLTRKALLSVLRAPPPGPNAVLNLSSQFRITYEEFDRAAHAFENIHVIELGDYGLKAREFSARRGVLEFADETKPPVIHLEYAECVVFRPTGGPDGYTRHEIFRTKAWHDLPLLVSDLFGQPRRVREMDRLQIADLLREERSADGRRTASGFEVTELVMELHRRIAAAFGPLVFVLIGAPVGILVRRSSKVGGLAAALPGLLVYYGLTLMGESMADQGTLLGPALAWARHLQSFAPAIMGGTAWASYAAVAGPIWTADVLLGAAGLALTVYVVRR